MMGDVGWPQMIPQAMMDNPSQWLTVIVDLVDAGECQMLPGNDRQQLMILVMADFNTWPLMMMLIYR